MAEDKKPNFSAFTSGMRGNEKPPTDGEGAGGKKSGDAGSAANASKKSKKIGDISNATNSAERQAAQTQGFKTKTHNAFEMVSEDDTHVTVKMPKKLFQGMQPKK
jgi:hypothetical protein